MRCRRLSASCAVIIAASIWHMERASALPGFTPAVPDASGEYVYYEDKTFSRTSYIGFLYYNDSAYAVRYYAPEDKAKGLPASSVGIVFSLDPAAGHIELTGEKIMDSVTPDDTGIVNYLHDMLYELNARRIKTGAVPASLSDTVRKDDFPEFGGAVTESYSCLIPLFNLRFIENDKGEAVLRVVTTGALRSSQDDSFTAFAGIPEKYSDGKHSFAKDKKAVPSVYTAPDGQTVRLDTQWTQSMENMWLLGDDALVSAVTIPQPSGGGKLSSSVLLRRMLQSSGRSYVSWRDLSVTEKDGASVINSVFYQPESGAVTRTFRIITMKDGGGWYFFTMSVFNSIYQTNHSYFDGIIAGYAVPAQGASRD